MKIFTYDAPNNEKEVMLSPWDSVVYYHSLLSCGFLAMDPRNGHVRAWVGGVDFKHRQYDHVTAKRQVGSTFKPIVYAAALEQGALPCDYFPNEVRTYADYENWRPENSENLYGGFYSMKGALTKSLNTITVQLMMQAGIDNVINLANRMGISSDLPQKPAIALGAGDISLKEMVTAYGVFANMGIRRDLFICFALKIKTVKS
jgi:penicillin-binding protein 1A